ncbi:DarT ssDNA thymidine ADP-ribosyltransferase family protein [Paenibacillus sp. GCM10012306]|uniref:type II toxin-antitoxin system toxin DNA ADP-ribosyl transferase DarT n=1 Tax=Paenibacillus sp. GCM10012306 TaxID=3317342 RepID=UPI0036214CC9
MAPVTFPNKYFYHFTHLDNIESIIENGLISTNEKKKNGITHVNVANERIQGRRSNMIVPCHPNGTIHDYVPFYFATTNPMLLSVVNRKNIDQPLVVYLAISIDKIQNSNVIFTDGSANRNTAPNFYSEPNDLDKLSWDKINITTWKKGTPDELHARMAEVLVYQKVPLDWIDSFIVYNQIGEEYIKKIFKEKGLGKPPISLQPFDSRFLYFTKFLMKGRENETLVTGPRFLKFLFENNVDSIIESRSENEPSSPAFQDVEDALNKIKDNFCIIDELDGIYQLETSNEMHNQKVCDHTKEVVKNLDLISYYNDLDDDDKALVKLAAYFHDIGKGPKSKWQDGIQSNYPDHPADSLKMMKRILVEEFEELTKYQIRLICLLVGYHDLIGDILKKDRSEKEIVDLGLNENELSMLAAISLADVKSIKPSWYRGLLIEIPDFIERL